MPLHRCLIARSAINFPRRMNDRFPGQNTEKKNHPTTFANSVSLFRIALKFVSRESEKFLYDQI